METEKPKTCTKRRKMGKIENPKPKGKHDCKVVFKMCCCKFGKTFAWETNLL